MFQKIHENKNSDFENDLNERKQNAINKKRCLDIDTDQNESSSRKLTFYGLVRSVK